MEKNKLSVKSLTEGALLAGLTALLAISGVYIPVLGAITSLIWTVPIIIVVVRHDLIVGILATIIAGLIMFLFLSPLTAVLLILQYGGLGILFGYLFRKKTSAGKTLVLGTIVAGLSFAITFNFFLLLTGTDLGSVQAELTKSLETIIEMYKNMGLFNENTGFSETEFRQMFNIMVEVFIALIPALVIIYGIAIASVNFFVGRIILKRLGEPITYLPTFSEWRLPWYLVYGVIIALGLVVLGNYIKTERLVQIGANILYVYFPILLIQGISVFSYFFKSWRLTRYLKVLLVVFILLYLNFWFIVTPFVGLFDMVLNIRRLP